MAGISWLTVITGTYLIYPWYHEGPREFLTGNEKLAGWETFGMKWKVHTGWLSPILMTCVGFIVTYYCSELVNRPSLHQILLTLFLLTQLVPYSSLDPDCYPAYFSGNRESPRD